MLNLTQLGALVLKLEFGSKLQPLIFVFVKKTLGLRGRRRRRTLTIINKALNINQKALFAIIIMIITGQLKIN